MAPDKPQHLLRLLRLFLIQHLQATTHHPRRIACHRLLVLPLRLLKAEAEQRLNTLTMLRLLLLLLLSTAALAQQPAHRTSRYHRATPYHATAPAAGKELAYYCASGNTVKCIIQPPAGDSTVARPP
jgi:hypothetical protein